MFSSISLGLAFLGQDKLHCVVLLPSPGTEDPTRVDLVISFLISMLRLVHNDSTTRPHTKVPYTLYARILIVKERNLAWPRGR